MDVKLFFKQFFCSHVAKLETEEYLYDKGLSLPDGSFYRLYKVYALTFKCLKCGKVEIEEVSRKNKGFLNEQRTTSDSRK